MGMAAEVKNLECPALSVAAASEPGRTNVSVCLSLSLLLQRNTPSKES